MTTFLKATEIGTRGATTLAGRYYTSPEIYREEQDRIFSRRWVCAAREDEIPSPGDYLLRTIAGESIIVLRDRAGGLRAFFNVCRHRGTRMCEAERGQLGDVIRCPYHSWTYGLDGRLLRAPSMSDLDGFDRNDYPLHAAGIASWEGWIFVSLDPERESFAQAFAPLIGKFARFNLRSLAVARRVTYDVRANWKLVVQNYSECYHCSLVHPALVRLTPAQSGENDLINGPFLGGYMTISAAGGTLSVSGRACGLPVGDLPAEDQQRVYYYSFFPSMLLSLHPDYVMAHTLWPDGPERTVVECSWLFNPESLGNPAFEPDDAVRFWDETNRQDWHVCELSQQGVSSRMYRPGPYSPRESISAAFDREYLKAMKR
ncbi:MAG: aromatic ring-hydroxylating dioxygenase subunit alpha [Gemmatimonadota bacterium]|nr:aromatic ring-hydroxylating dioxygenase subunit alpha [Gemmatimonadota bacterium]